MTQQNDSFEIRIEQSQSTLKKHTDRLIWALLIIEITAVCYTLPHNAHAFNLSWELKLSNLFAFLGLATLEGAFLFSAYHYTKGLLTTYEQTTWAKRSFYGMMAVLMLNSIVSQLIYMETNSWLTDLVIFYQGFILPITPIFAMVLCVLLVFNHPKTQQSISEYKHIATTMKAEQTQELEQQKAMQSVKLARIEAKKLHAEAEAEQIKVSAQDEIAALKLETEIQAKARELNGAKKKAELDSALSAVTNAQKEAEQKIKFEQTVSAQTNAAMRTEVTKILQSEELKEVISERAAQQVALTLDIKPNSALGKKLAKK